MAKVLHKDQTPAQVSNVQIIYDNELPKTGLGTSKPSYTKVRTMRKDATIAFARWLSVAPVLSSEWNIEAAKSAPDGARELIEEEIKVWKTRLVRSSFYGGMDFGWQPYEKIFKIREDGKVGIKNLKQLLQDYTYILINDSGDYNGLRQDASALNIINDIDLRTEDTLTISFDVEGTDWYGHSSMEVVEPVYDGYIQVANGAERYDRKVAGSHWIVTYPDGETEYNGVLTANYVIATKILNALQSSGSVAIPRDISAMVQLNVSGNAMENGWTIELKSDTSSAASNFDVRLRYYDTLKVRAFGMPERSVLEGQFGTKAEAESHSDASILNMEMRHQLLCDQYNLHLVNHLLRLNYGARAENSVWISPTAIVDKQRKALTDIYMKVLANPTGFAEAFKNMDIKGIEKQLQIPLSSEMKQEILVQGVENGV